MTDIRDFLDDLYACWARTTHSDTGYWTVREGDVVALGPEIDSPVAAGLALADAEFVAAIQCALPDLIRRTHEALDESDRADAERDARECRIAELELEVAELKKLSTL
jgi:hypothetical protein